MSRTRRQRTCGRGGAGIAPSGSMHDDWDDFPCRNDSGAVWDMAIQPRWKKVNLYYSEEKSNRTGEYRVV
eukprot:10712991-Karenia_brevis.AAC.1